MKNYIQAGNALDVVLTADTDGGEVVIMTDMAGVALKSGKTGETIAVAMTGVYELPKVAGTAFTQGKRLYWKADTGEVTSTATGNVQLGYAAYAAASAATLAAVSIVPA